MLYSSKRTENVSASSNEQQSNPYPLPHPATSSVGLMKSHKFIDLVKVYVQAGNGGNGCSSFRREKCVPNGGPDGGDGGHGGDVIFKADKDVSSLISIHYAPHRRAGNAGHGKGKQLHGRNGKNLMVKVPRGTEIYDKETGVMLGEVLDDGQEFIAARGGKGGKGNIHWKTSTRQAPTQQTDGIPGEQITMQLELKLVSDAGLVGFPNAGKSSLLTRISDAHPRVAAYPFTTLNPVIGTIVFDDYTRLTVADMPGLIEGASKGIGLGHAFLRHIERAPHLVFVIDMEGIDGREPWDDYTNLQNELQLHNKELMSRPAILLANKMDMPNAANNLAEFKRKTKTDPIQVSAETGKGIDEFKNALHTLCKQQG